MKLDEPFIITVITDLANTSSLLNAHLKDEKKTTQWLNSEHYLLEGKTPTELIFEDRTAELLKHINTLIKGSKIE